MRLPAANHSVHAHSYDGLGIFASLSIIKCDESGVGWDESATRAIGQAVNDIVPVVIGCGG